MRLHYYTFPEGTPEQTLLDNGCAVILKDSGAHIYPKYIPEDCRDRVEGIDRTVSGSISWIKKMIKQYGGSGWTEHIERDGSLFEVTEITLKGNNSRFKYNHHL